MCEDFVALLSCVGPVALRATQVLADVVASGGEAVARDLLHQRGVERLVALLFDLSDTERSSADWSVKSRMSQLSLFLSVCSLRVRVGVCLSLRCLVEQANMR